LFAGPASVDGPSGLKELAHIRKAGTSVF